jgi:hypothetical protein
MSQTGDARGKPVTLTKGSAKGGDAAKAPRPRTVVAAAAAVLLSGMFALIGALVLLGQRSWLTSEQQKANAKSVKSAVSSATASAQKSHADIAQASASASASAAKKYPLGGSQLNHQVSQQQSGALIMAIIVTLAMAFIANGVYRGRHWSRWGVVGFWLLATFTGTLGGISSLLSLGSGAPIAFKVPSVLASVFFIIAVVLVNLRPSIDYFALSRPARPAGAPQRRGLFAPRPPAGPRPGSSTAGSRAKSVLNSSASTRGDAYVQRQRAKKRAAANAESVARGAELARNRAKASKSRRIES